MHYAFKKPRMPAEKSHQGGEDGPSDGQPHRKRPRTEDKTRTESHIHLSDAEESSEEGMLFLTKIKNYNVLDTSQIKIYRNPN